MEGYYWVKLTARSEWEPACQVRDNRGDESWYVTGSSTKFVPFAIGPELTFPQPKGEPSS